MSSFRKRFRIPGWKQMKFLSYFLLIRTKSFHFRKRMCNGHTGLCECLLNLFRTSQMIMDWWAFDSSRLFNEISCIPFILSWIMTRFITSTKVHYCYGGIFFVIEEKRLNFYFSFYVEFSLRFNALIFKESLTVWARYLVPMKPVDVFQSMFFEWLLFVDVFHEYKIHEISEINS